MRIAVLGDSNVAALKTAWEGMAESHPGTYLTFFASRADGLSGLMAEGFALVAEDAALRGNLKFTSGGLDRIVPGDYDLLVIYGLRFLMSDDDEGVWSMAVRLTALRDWFSQCLSLTTLRKPRAISSIPCIVGPSPPTVAPSAAAQPLPAEELAMVERALQDTVLDGLGASLVRPPPSALVRPLNTDRRFVDQALTLAVGDFRDGGKVRANNHRHMNAEYGRLWLQFMFERLRADSGADA